MVSGLVVYAGTKDLQMCYEVKVSYLAELNLTSGYVKETLCMNTLVCTLMTLPWL